MREEVTLAASAASIKFVGVIEAWLRAEVTLKGTLIHERLVAEHGFTGSYQRVKMILAEARPRIAAELSAEDENPLSGRAGQHRL